MISPENREHLSIMMAFRAQGTRFSGGPE